MQENTTPLESRVARLESDVSHIRADVALLQVDLRDLRKTFDTKLDALNDKLELRFNTLSAQIGELKVWALTVIGGGVLTVLAHALHWF